VKALFLTGIREFDYRETEPPEAPDGWVRIRMRYVGICGSDVHYYQNGRIGDQVITFPFVLGHEGSGEILDGAGKLAAGTRVYVEPTNACGECDQCKTGRENTCRNIAFLGNPLEGPGCMCEEIVIPAKCAIPLPDEIGTKEAFLLEPLCIGRYAVERSKQAAGTTAAIVGAGPIGLSVLLGLSDVEPARVLVTEPISARREAAVGLGAAAAFDPGASGAYKAVYETSGGGVDVAYECVGTQESIDDATRMLKPGGKLVLIGIPPGVDRVTYDPNIMRRYEIDVINIRRQNMMIQPTMALLQRRRDSIKSLITHTFLPAQADEAFRLVEARADGVVKAALKF